MSNQEAIRIRVPRQDLDASSFFTCDEHSVQRWVDELPRANLGETTRQLYQALNELNRVRLLPPTRQSLLDILRSPIYQVSNALAKHYLNQAIVLPDQARKVVNLAETLHQQLACGYTIVATHSSALGKRLKGAKAEVLIATALHRAISDHSINLMRHYQLSEPGKDQLWHKLHQLYALCRQHKLPQRQVSDAELGDCSVENAYVRALLLGSAEPNQLRQEYFKQLIKPLALWAKHCRLGGARDGGLFVIDPDSDSPPVYRALYTDSIEDSWLSLDTDTLVQHIQQQAQQCRDSGANRDTLYNLPCELLQHLQSVWCEKSKRSFIRIDGRQHIDLCIGLSATHHFVSGELSFDILVQDKGAQTYTMMQENPFLKAPEQQHRQKDVWDSPYESNMGQLDVAVESIDYKINQQSLDKKAHAKYSSYEVSTVNASAHGYCVEWPDDNALQLKAGEIIGVKELNSHNWSIAIIRWIERSEEGKTLFGVELISPSASPYGARIITKTGAQAEYMRVLILPEVAMLKIPITLITPSVPFRKGSKVVLNQRGSEVQVQLTEKLNESGAFNQFEFHKIGVRDSDREQSENDDNFGSLWDNL